MRNNGDAEGGSTTEPHRTDDRRILESGTVRRYQRVFDVREKKGQRTNDAGKNVCSCLEHF